MSENDRHIFQTKTTILLIVPHVKINEVAHFGRLYAMHRPRSRHTHTDSLVHNKYDNTNYNELKCSSTVYEYNTLHFTSRIWVQYIFSPAHRARQWRKVISEHFCVPCDLQRKKQKLFKFTRKCVSIKLWYIRTLFWEWQYLQM